MDSVQRKYSKHGAKTDNRAHDPYCDSSSTRITFPSKHTYATTTTTGACVLRTGKNKKQNQIAMKRQRARVGEPCVGLLDGRTAIYKRDVDGCLDHTDTGSRSENNDDDDDDDDDKDRSSRNSNCHSNGFRHEGECTV